MTLQDVATVIKQVKADSPLDVKPDSLLTDLNIMSLYMMIIICEPEQKYNVKFEFETLKNVQTVNHLFNACTR